MRTLLREPPRPRAPSALRAGALLALAAVLAAGAPAVTAQASLERTVEILLEEGAAGGERERDEAARRLLELGGDALPHLLEVYCGGASATGDGGSAEGVDPGPRRAIAYAALCGGAPGAVVAALEGHVAGERDTGRLLAAVRVLEGLGSAEGLGLLFAAAARCGDLALRSPRVRRPVRAALAAILTRDPEACRALEPQLGGLEGELAILLVDALGTSDAPQALGLFPPLLRSEPELDLLLLEAIADLGSRYPWGLRDTAYEPAALVRPFLVEDDWRQRRAAAVALARLHDRESFPDLIHLLEDGHPAVRRAALWALQAMAGNPGLLYAEDWLDWYGRQEEWWGGEALELEARLEAGEPGPVLDAMRTLATRPLYRHEVAETLALAARDMPPELAVVACASLRTLQSRRAVPDLVALLFEGEEPVRQAAWQTLRALTGEELPLDPQRWDDYARAAER